MGKHIIVVGADFTDVAIDSRQRVQITPSVNPISVTAGSTQALTITTVPAEATLAVTSLDTGVATVSGSAGSYTITGVAAGNTNIQIVATPTDTQTYKPTTMTIGCTVTSAEVRTLLSIAVTTQPTKTTYTIGEALDLTGCVVTGTYNLAPWTENVTSSCTFVPANGSTLSTAGTQTVNISYSSKTTSLNVIVTAASDFATDSWSTIAASIKSGSDPYNVGDTKTDTITIGNNAYTGTFKIVDNTVGRYVTQSGVSHKVIELQELVHNGAATPSGFSWNSSGQLSDFASSTIFSTLNNTILSYLPQSLQSVLETTTVYSGTGTVAASASTNVAATDKLFTPCINEYGDAAYVLGNSNSSEGTPQYTYYSSLGVNLTSSDNVKYLKKAKIEDNTVYDRYWVRSPYGTTQSSTICAICLGTSGYAASRQINAEDTRVSVAFAW